MKSPGTKSPVSSTKKQRSASPSNATPRSAPSSSVFATMNSRFSGSKRVGLVVREGPVGLEEVRARVDRQALEDRRQHHAGHSVGRVDHDGERTDRLDVDEREHALDVRGPDVVRLDRPRPRCRRRRLRGAVADLEKPGLAADRQRPAPHDLQPGVLLRVVRGGDHDPAVQRELPDGEVDHLGPDEPEVEDVRAGRRGSLHHRCRHRRGRDAHVAADGDPFRLEVLDVRTADRPCAVLVELGGVDPADVVCLEDLRIEHASDANPSWVRSDVWGRFGAVRPS